MPSWDMMAWKSIVRMSQIDLDELLKNHSIQELCRMEQYQSVYLVITSFHQENKQR
jgi:hypothetical protein